MKKLTVLLIALQAIIGINMQAQSSIWRFGNYGGLKFNPDGTTSTSSGSASSNVAGATSITDINGNLMFYVAGKVLLDRSNNIIVTMDPYTGAEITPSLIVPVPGRCNKYVVFTRPAMPTSVQAIHVCLVTVNGSAPNYTVSASTVEALEFEDGAGFTEKLCATKDNSGSDPAYWVAVHDTHRGTTNGIGLIAFHLTVNNMANVNSTLDVLYALAGDSVPSPFTGAICDFNAPEGQMKFSKSGNKAALIVSDFHLLQVFNFNQATGAFTLLKSVPLPNNGASTIFNSLEFSPDENVIYVGERRAATQGKIIQVDYKPTTPTFTTVATANSLSSTDNIFNGLQLGPDNKIYVSGPHEGNTSLSVIKNPNGLGSACQYVQNTIPISGTNKLTLPYIVSGYAYSKLSVFPTSVTTCSPQSSILTANGGKNYVWTPGTTNNTNAYYTVNPTTTTTYTVTSLLPDGCTSSANVKVTVGSVGTTPIIKASSSKLCPGISSSTLSLQDDLFYYGVAYQWQTISCSGVAANIAGATSSQYTATSSNQYRLRIGCSGSYSYSNIITIAYSSTSCSYAASPCSTGGGGCVGCRPNTTTGVDEEQEISNAINIYPNPNNGQFNVAVTSAKETDAIVSVVNLMGQEVYKIAHTFTKGENQLQLDVTNYPKGVYFVRVSGSNTQLQMKMVYQ